MKKVTLIFTSLMIAFSLVGCAANSNDQKEETAIKNEIGKTVDTSNNLQIKVTKVATGFGESSDKKDMLQVTFSVKNTDKVTSGAGAADFKVKADNDKTYDVYGLEAKNFGTEIKAGQTITGTGYYEIPAKTKTVTVYYAPLGKKKAQWQLKVPAK
ncbi:hypothetical protein BMT55_12830 [Listeria newyorkensis]|uniref:DUF4352 domain-containing protein n=1 Tax=Listeria newyorkensis TaxID=1497681 RepID=A0ABX4XJY6_9LIST|nr:DUF4352 domain-containing protein [Listeria newyorkensis]KGL45581.1 hypothetical protein EP58_03700 [Listeria newyorkensis]PNP89377.1 hypothetical protein BMT55_12830 [Listeria newyorkensis]WAO22949.1 DUF4352 domain-containing protein [Listeria newyorkensis]SQC57233.1 Telomeric repeat-binding factor 2 [Listeria newyorkensis]